MVGLQSSGWQKSAPFAFDVVILGSAPQDCRCTGFTFALKCGRFKQTSRRRQHALGTGRIAAVVESTDSLESHVQDTLVAGAGLCNEAAVRNAIEAGEDSINWLVEQAPTLMNLTVSST